MARYFTAEAANAIIPQIVPLIHRLQSIRDSMRANERASAAVLGRSIRGNGHHIDDEGSARALQKEREDLVHRFQETIDEATRLGAEIKDPDMGLVDFRSMREGKEVYLCWRLGEEGIAYWHDLNTGYAGRQPL